MATLSKRSIEAALRQQVDQACRRAVLLPEAKLLEALRRMSRMALLHFHRLYGIRERDREQVSEIPGAAQELLLLLLWPRLYADRPPPPLLSACMSTVTKSVDLAIRHEDGYGLWHPLDFMQDDIDVGEELERTGNRKRGNGTVVPGKMSIRAA